MTESAYAKTPWPGVCDRRPSFCGGSETLKTRSRKYPGLVYNVRSSRRRPAHANHPTRAAAHPRQTSHRQQAPPPPPLTPPPSPPRLPPPETSRRISPHLQTCTPPPACHRTRPGRHVRRSRAPPPLPQAGRRRTPRRRPPPALRWRCARPLAAAAATVGTTARRRRRRRRSHHPSQSRRWRARQRRQPRQGRGRWRCRRPSPLPTAAELVHRQTMAGARSRGAPQRAGPPSTLPPRRRAGGGASDHAISRATGGVAAGGDNHTRARGGEWGWSPRRRGSRPRAGCVGRGRSRTDARAGGVSGVCGLCGGDPDDRGGAAVGSSRRPSGSPLIQDDGSRASA